MIFFTLNILIGCKTKSFFCNSVHPEVDSFHDLLLRAIKIMFLSIATEAALEAGKILLKHLGNVKQIEVKHDQLFNLVTEVDRAAEECIVDIIHTYFPDHSILAEEGGAIDLDSDCKWIIDPLDGTTNFMHALPVFCISIALEKAGEVLAGVVYNPAVDEVFHVEKGSGAFLNNKKIHVSSTSNIERSLLVTGFPYNVRENPDHCFERFTAFMHAAHGIRRLGSAAIDCAYVACGRFDGFWEVWLHPWDCAAGALMIREAGGVTTDFYGKPHSIYSRQFLGSNGFMHEKMMEILKQAEEK